MNINKIYFFLKEEYSPMVNYFIAWPNDFIECLKNLSEKRGSMHEFHGYEIHADHSVTFYDFSSKEEKSISIGMSDFLILIEPLKLDYLIEFSEDKEEVNLLIQKIRNMLIKEDDFNNIGRIKKKYANMLLSIWNRYWENKKWAWKSLPGEIESRYDLLKPILDSWEKQGFIKIVLDENENIFINVITIPNKIS